MDIKQKLANQYDNIAIYTAGFYAAPEDQLNTRSQLMATLKSFVLNQHAEDPFSLQIMLTNGEINIMPLGLLSLDDLKEYEDEQRKKHGLLNLDDQIPLVVQFASHTEDAQVQKKVVATTDALFSNFEDTFLQLWDAVKADLDLNQQLLIEVVTDLVEDSQDVKHDYLKNFANLTPKQRQDKLGFTLKDTDLNRFSAFMADMHEVQAIVMSAAAFTKQEIIGENLFTQVMADNVRRGTFFWVLDNTFYEILYYFIEKYRSAENGATVVKHLHHIKKSLLPNMRNDAFERVQAYLNDPKKSVDMTHYFTDLFIPVAEQLSAEIDKFQSQKH